MFHAGTAHESQGAEDPPAAQPHAGLKLMENAIREFLIASGVDTSDPHLTETPARVARTHFEELLSGYRVSLEDIFKTFEESNGPIVVVRDIPVYSLCAHHMLPFYGTASIGYQPNGRILGLSKIARLVDCLARRLQVQERLTRQVVEAIETHLNPRGVAVLVRAEHLCMAMRGIRKPNTETVTYWATGEFKSNSESEKQIFSLLHDR
jgi:GTP cyclohydrolase IA